MVRRKLDAFIIGKDARPFILGSVEKGLNEPFAGGGGEVSSETDTKIEIAGIE